MTSVGCVLIHGMNTVTELADISLVIVIMHRGGLVVVSMKPGVAW